MPALKGKTDKIVGTAKEAIAEIIGDAKLQEEGKTQQRKGAADDKADQSDVEPFGGLDKLT
jgi:uncharacterized protein YjbJ (UPF0337 family)